MLWANIDRVIQTKRPDKIITRKQCSIIDLSVLFDQNVSAKCFKKVSKYKEIEISIQKK